LKPKTHFPFVASKLPLKILLGSAAAWASTQAWLAKNAASMRFEARLKNRMNSPLLVICKLINSRRKYGKVR